MRQKIQHLSYAIQQYNGDYLPEVDEYWAIPDREKYRQMFIDTLYAIAELYFEKEVYKSSLRYCHRALEEDPVNEEVHRLAMKIHAVTGNKAEIIRQYESCRQELEEKFDVSHQNRLNFSTILYSTHNSTRTAGRGSYCHAKYY
jgi:two-component SAPR family response regulator